MINKLLKEKFPFVSEYFEELIKNNINKFPQSIVFEGLDIIGQYMFSKELARILNCTEGGDENCGCINCRWIRNNKHPGVNVVSPIDFKDDASKTVISINQAKKITSSLRETSDYYRFFIFSDAKVKERTAGEQALIKEYASLGFQLDEGNEIENGWTPSPLNMKVFKAEASNSLLKSIEEPPEKTCFIFLTKNKEDLISTIVSRSNVFKLAGKRRGYSKEDFAKIKELVKNYPDFSFNHDIENALETIFCVENAVKGGGVDIFDFFDEFQEYILNFLKENSQKDEIAKKFENHIKLVQKAKTRMKASMGAGTVLMSMFLDIAKY